MKKINYNWFRTSSKILAFELVHSKKVNLIGFFDSKNKILKKILIQKNNYQFIQKLKK